MPEKFLPIGTVVLLKDGTVYGFGRNEHGELGILNNTNKLLPTQMDGIANAVKVQANSSGSTNHKDFEK